MKKNDAIILPTLPPLTLYIHFPWCLQKCPYCDFNSHACDAQNIPFDAYFQALKIDLLNTLPLIEAGREIISIFIGGGTPSLMPPFYVENLLTFIQSHFQLKNNCEITLEANPGAHEYGRFADFYKAGINRVSLGVQSFDDKKLKSIGRIHSAKQAINAMTELAHTFDKWNIDLMYGLPDQSIKDLILDIDIATSFTPPHLSVYHLTLEANTYFAKYPPKLPDEDLTSQMLDLITHQLTKAGMHRYEVSAYSRSGYQCEHNLNYWQFGDYIGIGAGAHGKISSHNGVARQIKYRDPDLYIKNTIAGNALASQRVVTKEELAFEFLLGALRLKDGVTTNLFEKRTGLKIQTISTEIKKAQDLGLLYPSHQLLKPTEKGFDFLSDLLELFLPEL